MPAVVVNHRLEALLVEAGYGQAHSAFARQVNLGVRTLGLDVHYDAASVYWWLRGRRPSPPAPRVIAEVLARRLRRAVGPADLGFDDIFLATEEGLGFAADLPQTRRALSDLWRVPSAVHRRSTSYVPAADAEAGWRWRFDPDDPDVSHQGSRRVTLDDVQALRASRHGFLDLDRRHGGGQRAVLLQWLRDDVEPLLHGSYTDAVGRGLFGVVAELTGQVAFMSYDIGDHALAQRYFIQALRLAKAAGRPGLGAHFLANMSTQAVYLGHAGEAVRLAQAAVDGGRGHAGPAGTSRLRTAEAAAHAAAGDARACMAALGQAEDAAAGDGAEPADWAGYFTRAHLAGTAVRCLRDLGLPEQALRYAGPALELRPDAVRTRALHTALVASVYTEGPQADPEHAASLGMLALDLAVGVRSRRTSDRVKDLRRRLAPHRTLSPVAAFLQASREPWSSMGG